MPKIIKKTGERVVAEKFKSREEYLIYLWHIFAYEFVKKIISSKSSVLEVGSGSGYGADRLSKNVANIVGIDVAEDVIEYSTEKYSSENCIFKKYDGVKIPYENNTFNAVISFQVIEHIKDDKNYVLEIQRVLKDDGIFILTTPNKLLRLKPNQKLFNRFHVREYYSYELENLLKEFFCDIKIVGISGSEEINKIERERIRRISNIIRFDFLNIKKFIPEFLKIEIIKIIKKVFCFREKNDINKNHAFLKEYSVKDFYVTNDIKNGFDLLAICKK